MREPDEIRGLDESFQRLRRAVLCRRPGDVVLQRVVFHSAEQVLPRARGRRRVPLSRGYGHPRARAAGGVRGVPPRTVPRWLVDALPTAVPFGLRKTGRGWSGPFGGSPSMPEPAPVFSGELRYTPIGHMAVHGFGHGESRHVFSRRSGREAHGRRQSSLLHEQTIDDRLAVLGYPGRHARHRRRHHVLRAGRSTARHASLPEAADDLETEPVLTVDLNLKPAETEELRAASKRSSSSDRPADTSPTGFRPTDRGHASVTFAAASSRRSFELPSGSRGGEAGRDTLA